MTTSPSTRPHARLRAFRTPVRGHAFAPSPPPSVAVSPGSPAHLAREPGNPADPHAVAVYVSVPGAPAVAGAARWRVGYLDRAVAARLAPRLDAGLCLRAALDGWVGEPDGRWLRPLLLIEPATRSEPATGPEPAARSGREGAGTDGTALWGRPPGVTRRVLRRVGAGPGASHDSSLRI